MCTAAFSLLVCCLVCDPDPDLGFSEAWYRERFLGEIRGALNDYTLIYRGGTDASTPPSSARIRRQAAFRAGLCAEKLGDPARARSAYEWLRLNGPPEGLWTRKARFRLAALAPAARQTPVGVPGTPANDRARSLRHEMEERRRRRRVAAGILGSTVARRRELERERQRLARRLRSVGVEFSWRPDPPPLPAVDDRRRGEEAGGEDDGLAVDLAAYLDTLALDADDRAHLETRIAGRLELEGLRALRAGDLGRAARAFRLQIELGSRSGVEAEVGVETRQAAEFLQTVREILSLAEGLRSIARRLIGGALQSQESVVPKSMSESLRGARQALRENRPDDALRSLRAVLLAGDWAPPGVRQDSRARALELEASRRYRLLVPGWKDENENGGAWSDSLAARITLDMEDLVIDLLDDLGMAPSRDRLPAPRLENRERMVPRLRREVTRVLELIDRRVATGAGDLADPSTSSTPVSASGEADLRTLVEDTHTLAEWFPDDLDPGGQIRRRLRRHLR